MRNNKHRTQVQLEKELKELKALHKSMWETYGSELCGAEMIAEEDKLIEKIKLCAKAK